MARGRAKAAPVASDGPDVAGQADEPRAGFLGGVTRLAAQAQRGARKVTGAAHDLRGSPVLQHAVAARERGNLEAAFWLLDEEFTRSPDGPDVAINYWDVALSLGRVDIARGAGVKLIESCAAEGAPELAAQHWLELVGETPDALVSPTAIAMFLPALKQRLEEAGREDADDPLTLGGYLRRAVRHAVDPRNTGLHPGVALRIFEEGRDINPEAARRAAETALESPNLHDAKRARLNEWLAGGSLESPGAEEATATPAAAPPRQNSALDHANGGLSSDEIEQAAARLPASKAARSAVVSDETPPADAPPKPQSQPREGALVCAARLHGLYEDGLGLEGVDGGRLAYRDIEAVAVAKVMGIEDHPITVIDFITNWSRRAREPLKIVRLRATELDLDALVTRKHALGSKLAALMVDILERTSAVPLPDPESALATRITSFETPALYIRIGLRVVTAPAPTA